MATLTITATEFPDASPPAVRLDVTASGTPTVTEATVTRTDPDGRTYPVRTSTGGLLAVSGGVATVWDYEKLTYGTQSTYEVSADGATSDTATASLNGVEDVWLINPGFPARSVRLLVTEIGDITRPADRGVFAILGRQDPIAVTGGARPTGSGAIGVRTKTDAERKALDLLLSDGATLLLNLPSSGWGMESCYVSVGDVTVARTIEYAPWPWREWSLPFQVVGRPAGGSQALRTWATVAVEYPTWADVAATGLTWAEIANPIT